MPLITLKNDSHFTQARVYLKDISNPILNPRQVQIASRKLCPFKYCDCVGPLKMSGDDNPKWVWEKDGGGNKTKSVRLILKPKG